jgi:hypothetical protein
LFRNADHEANSYLIHNDFVKIHNEERKLAVMCLQYMLFDCFDSNLSEDEVKEYTYRGYYAFQDYAILHWVDHLEASIPYLLENSMESSDDVGSAINDFCDAFGSAEAGRDYISQELRDRCQHLEMADYFENLLLLISYTRKIRAKEETIVGLGELGDVISRNRSILEGLRSSGTLEANAKSNLEQCYGQYWHKCPRHACYFFHEGFLDSTRRDNHVSRHEKPFFCTEASCPRIHLGFITEKELKKHMNINHPDPAALFPKIKKPAAKHACDICSKDFTRAHNLKAHKRTHANERPFGCSLCDRAFVRKQDRERHERLHTTKNRQLGESSQDITIVSEMESSEPGSLESTGTVESASE